MQEHVLSIIVIAGDRPANLERLLDGLCNQTLPADEIVIVHTGSKSLSEQLIEALLDRFTHRVHIVEANGESYRLKAAKRRSKKTTSNRRCFFVYIMH